MTDSLQKWVKDLPQVPATTQNRDFRFDVDATTNDGSSSQELKLIIESLIVIPIQVD